MKKLLTAALLVLFTTVSAFAADVKVNSSTVLETFKSQFKNATDVSYEVKNEYVQVTFVQDNKTQQAFYDHAGQMIGVSSATTIDQLPTAAKRTFAKKYAGYTVKEAIQFDNDFDHLYYIAAENEKESVILQVNGSFLSLYKKQLKK